MLSASKPFRRATNITETYNAVNPEQPLLPGDQRYVDCAPWRGDEHIVNIIAQRINRAQAATPVQHLKQLLAGHRGCDKSTELPLLKDRLEIVLEYQNGERWANLHPAVQEIHNQKAFSDTDQRRFALIFICVNL